MARAIKIIIVLIVLGNAVYYLGGLIAYSHPSVLVVPLSVVGRTPRCPAAEVSRGLYSHTHEAATTERLLKTTRVLEKDQKGFTLLETPKGRYWVPGIDDPVLPRLLAELLAQQEHKIYGEGRLGVRPGDIVLDCGAHVGVYVREALHAGAKLIVAIEPATENVECLRRNFSSEIAEGRVIVSPVGVWNKEDVLTLYTNRNSAGDSFVLRSGDVKQAYNVRAVTIDKLVDELKLERVNFIKMDIKGAEREAITGASGVMAKYKPRMAVAAEHLPGDAEAIPALVREARADYRMECGVCFLRAAQISPEVLHFY